MLCIWDLGICGLGIWDYGTSKHELNVSIVSIEFGERSEPDGLGRAARVGQLARAEGDWTGASTKQSSAKRYASKTVKPIKRWVLKTASLLKARH